MGALRPSGFCLTVVCPAMRPKHQGSWVVAGPAEALVRLDPLIAARRNRQPVMVIERAAGTPLLPSEREIPEDAEGILAIGPRRCSPRRGLPGLWLHTHTGRRVPVGWLPDSGVALHDYAQTAVRILERADAERTLIVLGQWEDRFLRVGMRTQRWMERHDEEAPGFLWTADRISRTDMLGGWSQGPALAVYFGHGRPRGWAGYHGVRTDHFERPWPEPTGALLALCCENASRWRTGLSFAEGLVLKGVVGAVFAAVTKTRHEDNRRWGPALCEAYTEHRPATLAELVEKAEVPAALRESGPYRFIGDPLMPLRGATGVARRSAQVFAPAAEDPLPGW